MWKELIQSLDAKCEFFPPASHSDLIVVERLLHITFPDELKLLLSETNGVFGEYEAGVIWPLDRIVEYNLDAWNDSYFKLQHPLNSLLFFADAGNGDWFGFSISDGQVTLPAIFVWNHEDSRIRSIASSLQNYLRGWLVGTLKV